MAADTTFSPPPDLSDLVLKTLKSEGSVSDRDVEQAENLRNSHSSSLLITLNQIGVVSDDRLARTFAAVTGLPLVEADGVTTHLEPKTPLNPDFQKDTMCLLLSDRGPLLVVDPLDERLARAAEFALGFAPPRQIVRLGDWRRLFDDIYGSEREELGEASHEEDEFALELADQSRDAPIVRQVSAWLSDAADIGASDVHFDTKRNAFEVLFRQDGTLRPVSTQPKSAAASVITRIKVIANLDLGERNKAQDGRATIVVRGRRLDVRVSIIPTIDGESAVIRLLDRQDNLLSIDGLGFEETIKSELRGVIQQRHGMFVVAGPTGSGKTTTLYACIEELKGRGLKILSVEDPVEYHFDHVSQVQISEKAGRTFSDALRSFMRHDPDVILVGEIRDPETASVAVQAALSGHLVLATLHAIDSTRIRTRLIDMGVEPFKLDACLIGSMSQRLIKRLCGDCRKSAPVSESMRALLLENSIEVPEHIHEEAGCESCDWYGHRGRLALADLQTQGSSIQDQTLQTAALKRLVDGETSMREIGGLID